MRSNIIFEDESILVVYKPAGLATQTAKVGQADTVSELKNYLAAGKKGNAPYVGVIHRLDQPVEGLLVFAKEKRWAAELTAQLSEGSLNKQYYAVLCGQPSEKKLELVDYLLKDAACAKVVTERKDEYPEAKRAVLQYEVLQTLSETGITLVDIHIDTGRFHQIRAQMAHVGYPLLGDAKYGTEASLVLGRKLGVRQLALCAYKLEFIHPKTKKLLAFLVEPEGAAFRLFPQGIRFQDK